MTVADVTHPEDRAQDAKALMKFACGERAEYATEKRYLCKDGSTRRVHLHAAVLRNSQGVPVSLIGVIQDISRRKHAEEALTLALPVASAVRHRSLLTHHEDPTAIQTASVA